MSTEAPIVLVGSDGAALVEDAVRRADERTAIWIGTPTDAELAEFETEIGPHSP